MAKVVGVTFDLDDTLWSGSAVLSHAETCFHNHIAEHLPEIAGRFQPSDFRQTMIELAREHPDKAHNYTFLRKSALQQCAERVGADNFALKNGLSLEAELKRAYQAFLVPRSSPTLFAGVEDLFQNLSSHLKETAASQGIDPTHSLVGLVTNGNCDLAHLPASFLDHVAFLLSAEDVGRPKPHQEIFDQAAKRFPSGIDRSQLVHVGDHYECDVLGAKKAGFRTIWVYPDADTSEQTGAFDAADAIVEDVSEVLTVIERWNRA